MKKLLVLLFMLSIARLAGAQSHQTLSDEGYQDNKIVFQVVTQDTLAHKALMKQLNNIRSVAPNTPIEVVCHGPGLYMLVTERTVIQKQIKEHAAKGISFVACEFLPERTECSQKKPWCGGQLCKPGAFKLLPKRPRAGVI
ncbi:MAG: hypothetical protein IPO07_22980 [Haliscomenobacter sp.]|nr:hypothetical protein [Haliscomenobacter sp.]MBK9491332.1 hypothetical protein [Haliscomenobacter sp.]